MNDSYLGQIMLFAGNFAPVGWALCNGQLLPISQNQALFAVIGTMYGGDGVSNFALPDLRGRAPICFGQGPALQNYEVGEKGGAETVALTAAQMPAHSHTVSFGCDTNPGGSVSSPQNAYLCAQDPGIYSSTTNAPMGPGACQPAGGSQGHENRAPYLAMNYVIALQGVFPSRG
jgi:microcystin-dependent protein